MIHCLLHGSKIKIRIVMMAVYQENYLHFLLSKEELSLTLSQIHFLQHPLQAAQTSSFNRPSVYRQDTGSVNFKLQK